MATNTQIDADRTVDVLAAISEFTRAAAGPGQPQAAFAAFDQLAFRCFGHKLFTLLAWQGGADLVERIYSGRPVEYPVSASKRMGPTAWGEHVLHRGKPWIGRDADAIRWAFPDHELIASLGCAASINAPVRWNGAVLGAINVLDAAGAYDDADLALLDALSVLLVTPFLEQRQLAR